MRKTPSWPSRVAENGGSARQNLSGRGLLQAYDISSSGSEPMCLILFSYDDHPRYRLVVAANRDEFFGRPTQPARFWNDASHVLAGRDEKAGGTWMGVTRHARWAAITNYRDPSPRTDDARSRGHLVADYLKEQAEPADYLGRVAEEADRYNGFNVLVGTLDTIGYYSNRDGAARRLAPGLYGLSNHLLDTGWPKVERGRKKMRRVLDQDEVAPEEIFDLLHDTTQPDDERLPDTGIGLAGERVLSPMFIEGDRYGTRSSTVLLIDRAGHVTFVERTFDQGRATMTQRYDFDIASAPARMDS